MDGQVFEVMRLALQAVLVVGAPVVLVLSLAGTLVSVLQAATLIHEPAVGYGVRVAALAVLIYFLYPAAAETLLRLAETAMR